MITEAIIYRVHHIKGQNGTGTAFIVQRDEKQYLVTAKHIFPDLQSGDIVDFGLYYKENWISSSGERIYFHDIESVDIGVIPLKKHIYKGVNIEISYNNLALGQDVYFLGYPYNLKSKRYGSNHPFPMPLIKKGVFSALIKDENGAEMFYLDGHNNPGFSGGPAIFKSIHDGNEYIFGVISAYILQSGKISTPMGELEYHENSGIVVTYSADYINSIIDRI